MRATKAFYAERLQLLRHRCYYETRHALADGALSKPDACERCGAGGDIEGHHDDYSDPMAITWLCRLCHKAEHRRLRMRAAGARVEDKVVNSDTK